MDHQTFDRLARSLGARRTRRQALTALTATAMSLAISNQLAQATLTCELYCPENIDAWTDPGTCTAAVVVPPAILNGYCGENPVIDCDYPLDGDFPIGATTILCNVTGYNAPCTVTVVVNDDSELAVTCPADIEEVVEGPTAVSFDQATVGTACGSGNAPANCDHASGDVFPIGTTTVICSIPQGSGGLPETCAFAVTLQLAVPTATDPATEIPETMAPTPETTIDPTEHPGTIVPTAVDPTSIPADPTATATIAPVSQLPNTGAGSGGPSEATRLLPVAIAGAGLAVLTRLGLRQRPAEAPGSIDE